MRLVRRFLLLILIGACALLPGTALAGPGDLDTSFGNGGKATIDLGADEGAQHVILQPDGKILISGNFDTGNFVSDLFVARVLNPQGTIDNSYGLGSGWSRLNFATLDSGSAIALQPDGKIIAATTAEGSSRTGMAVARLLNPQGTLDPSFHPPSGFNVLNFGGSTTSDESVSDLILQPDGKILIGGISDYRGTADMAIARVLNPDGTLDGGYGLGTGGSVFDFSGPGAFDFGRAIALQPNGRIVIAGVAGLASANSDFGIGRVVVPDGSADPSFGNGAGTQRVDFGGSDFGADVAVQPDGKIVLAGTTGGQDMGVARLLSNGDPDKSFAGGGKAIVDFGGNDGASGLALQPDGKMILAGFSGQSFAIARLQPNGSLDTTFGNGGRSLVDFGPNSFADELVLQPNGDIIVGGSFGPTESSNIALARLQGDPPGGSASSKCAGKKATVIGTNAKDKLKGTKKRDVISAGNAKDVVKGLAGNDLICGGKGPDTLFGGKGNDTLLGQASKDVLRGGPGKKDKTLGGAAKDIEKP